MKILTVTALLFCLLLPLNADDSITFSGGTSSVSLQDGKRSVNLAGGAYVTVDTLSITADSIIIEGDDYDKITCRGSILITDEERGLTIRTSALYYDRTAERLLISSWCELNDTQNELAASASALYYDMREEKLELSMRVNLVKNTSSGMLSASCESMIYDRNEESLILSGPADVKWKDDTYSASVIAIDLESERIRLEGQIGGHVYG